MMTELCSPAKGGKNGTKYRPLCPRRRERRVRSLHSGCRKHTSQLVTLAMQSVAYEKGVKRESNLRRMVTPILQIALKNNKVIKFEEITYEQSLKWLP
jgi:hypothetical protein